MKYFIFIFVLLYDYSRSRIRIAKAIAVSFACAVFLFSAVAGLIYSSYIITGDESPLGSRAVRTLLKSGFLCQYDNLRNITYTYGRPTDVRDLVYFSRQYGLDTGFTPEKWEELVSGTDIDTAEGIFGYLREEKIFLDFEVLKACFLKMSADDYRSFLNAVNCKKYFSSYYKDHSSEFMAIYSSGEKSIKLWVIDCLAYAADPSSVSFLIDLLTEIDRDIPRRAYNALWSITGFNPAGTLKREIYDLDVINEFILYRDGLLRKSP